MDDLDAIYNSVHSKESFFDFISALASDAVQAEIGRETANVWENIKVSTFLQAMHAWGADTSMLPENPTWKHFATMLMAGSGYE